MTIIAMDMIAETATNTCMVATDTTVTDMCKPASVAVTVTTMCMFGKAAIITCTAAWDTNKSGSLAYPNKITPP